MTLVAILGQVAMFEALSLHLFVLPMCARLSVAWDIWTGLCHDFLAFSLVSSASFAHGNSRSIPKATQFCFRKMRVFLAVHNITFLIDLTNVSKFDNAQEVI